MGLPVTYDVLGASLGGKLKSDRVEQPGAGSDLINKDESILPPSLGGTGTGTTLQKGSIPFAGDGGVFEEDPENLNYDVDTKILTAFILNVLTGIRVAGAAALGNVLRGDGTNFVSAADEIIEAIVKRLRETGGPTTLLMGAVADGEYFKRSGTSIIGDSSPDDVGSSWEVITNGDTTTPEIIFAGGDVIMAETCNGSAC